MVPRALAAARSVVVTVPVGMTPVLPLGGNSWACAVCRSRVAPRRVVRTAEGWRIVTGDVSCRELVRPVAVAWSLAQRRICGDEDDRRFGCGRVLLVRPLIPRPLPGRSIAALLGREPMGAYEVVVTDGNGDPIVIRNAPLLNDGTPMPTRYWLVGLSQRRAVDHLEAAGGVKAAGAAVDPVSLASAHAVYAAERDAAIPSSWSGPRPSGGVGGTRLGVKCLHAHYAWYLAGGDDPVGGWVHDQLAGAAPR